MAQPRRTESPQDDPEHPDTPPEPNAVPDPAHDIGEPDAAPPAEVEPRLALDEFRSLHAPHTARGASVQHAALAALRRWMRDHGVDPDRHYTREQWVEFYSKMLEHAA